MTYLHSSKRLSWTGALTALAISLLPTTPVLAEKLPNILILYADDMGMGDLAIQNPDSKIPTPHLDKLAQSGMRFTDGHSSSGICTPSRYALLTGRHHWRKFHRFGRQFDPSYFDKEELTMPEMLKEVGYTTAHIGKWHLGFGWKSILKPGVVFEGRTKRAARPDIFDWSKKIEDGPTAHGFDYSFTDAVINFPPYTWIENDRVLKAPDIMKDESLWKPIKEGGWESRPGPMVTGWDPYENIPTLTRKAVEYVNKQAESPEPFFLYFALPSPHAPIIPNDEFDGTSQAGPYGDFMVETDDACGQILAALEKSGQADNTIVIFSADNGSEHYMKPRFLKYGHNSSGKFRGRKRDIFEGGHRVPFVVKWPGVTAPGSVSDALISQVDIMTTLATITGAKIPEGKAEDGMDMTPVLRGETDTIRNTLVYNTWHGDHFGIRKNGWVYLVNAKTEHQEYQEAAGFTKIETPDALFNLDEDIRQNKNLVQEYPEKVEELKKLLKKIKASGY